VPRGQRAARVWTHVVDGVIDTLVLEHGDHSTWNRIRPAFTRRDITDAGDCVKVRHGLSEGLGIRVRRTGRRPIERRRSKWSCVILGGTGDKGSESFFRSATWMLENANAAWSPT
jgi:hypothetical protein